MPNVTRRWPTSTRSSWTGWAPWSRPGAHGDLGAHLGRVPPCDDPSGDPQVHDHVLVANLARMGDERGGWKGLDTGLLRDHLHAATAVGRMAAAAKAVELGYGIEADPGPSGRLGGWAIAGIPREAWEVHATRSAQIDEAVGPGASYQSRSVAARATRTARHTSGSRIWWSGGGMSWPAPVTHGRTGGFSRACRPGLRAAGTGRARRASPTS